MYDFRKIEEESRKVWKKHSKKIETSVHEIPKRKLFSFLEGPPTANAPPALHHLEVRTYKDLINKFRFMQGFSVPRKGGWDCHGLPVEVQVEKQLGLKSKKDVIKYGTDKFIKKAKDSVFSYIKEWEKSTEELNYLIDLNDPYRTLDNNFIESVWWSLKELHKKDLLYEGYKVVPFCPRCGTPLSSHEVAQGYKDIKEESVYIAFKVKGKKDEYILAWTTTPWTLPGNVALAVGNELDYIKVQLEDGDKAILSKDRLEVLRGKYKILETMKGRDLVGLEYEPLFNIEETQNENSHKIIPADFVTTENGTGIVHTAVMYGEDDYNVGIALGLPAVHTVGEDGKFLDIVPQFKRRFVKEAEKDIIFYLKEKQNLYKTEKISHSYPFCWRCDSPLLYYAINSWFVKVSEVRKRLVELNREINWEPSHIKDGRFGKWLEGAKDWALSRFKFWGTPLPVWKCNACDNIEIVGSIDELKKLSPKELTSIDLHKPWIDSVKLKCKSCKGEMSRVSDVIDCWYDSGAASFAQFHYPFENKKEFEKRFPYDFISEAIDQTRGWFYTLHVLATILFDKPAYKNVICAGHVVDENGEKMSKSKGNVIIPRDIIDKAGVDAVRLQFCASEAGSQKRFSYDLMREAVLPFLNVLYNLNNYYSTSENKKNKNQIEDKWILSKLNSLISDVTHDLENYKISESFLKIQNFVVNDFSRGYVQITRDREDTKEILGEVLEKVSLLLAPFAPHISELVYSNFNKESVHLATWPKADKKKVDKNLEERAENSFKIIESGLRKRDQEGIGLRWPLQKVIIFAKGKNNYDGFSDIIKSRLNVKEIGFKSPSSKETEFSVELDTKQTPELEAEGFARELSRQIQAERKKAGLVKEDKIILHIEVEDKDLSEKILSNMEFVSERVNAKKYSLDRLAETSVKGSYIHEEEFIIKGKRFKISFDKC
ncbi:MAG: isoleucine--tRNA ligase [Nanoarchaeota archaeon]|nr:isoleucine--tRNA ligase [Nanoarchaeota archaeon]